MSMSNPTEAAAIAGKLQWIDGTAWTHESFMSDTLDINEGHNCMRIQNPYFGDRSCSTSLNYICQYDCFNLNTNGNG